MSVVKRVNWAHFDLSEGRLPPPRVFQGQSWLDCTQWASADLLTSKRAGRSAVQSSLYPLSLTFLKSANQCMPSLCHPTMAATGGTPELGVNYLEKGQSELSWRALLLIFLFSFLYFKDFIFCQSWAKYDSAFLLILN